MGPDVAVTNGWLSFTSLESFSRVMQQLHNSYESSKGLATWESSYAGQGFRSLRSSYEQIDADTTEDKAGVDC